MEFTKRQYNLLRFVQSQHGDQKRKYTGEPYWTHLVSVAKIVSGFDNEFPNVEVALCHDLFEDTPCPRLTLYQKLGEFGYTPQEKAHILQGIIDLTDQYTKGNYPHLNREERKHLEADRLSTILPSSQTVKCADLIDNSNSIVQHDPGFARVYLGEKERILKIMDGGDVSIYNEALRILNEAKQKLDI